ncbi:glutaredoxin [Georgenia sp. M64]|uniref:glutaredoxin n=1 Tax=Georgenia sp. M64 TaxID=3120520 RepID=UPI0030E46713
MDGQVPVLTVVHAPACHLCDDAVEALREIAAVQPLRVEVVELESPEGRRLAAEHRPAMNPLVLLDGARFSAGRLPRRKLLKALAERSRRAAAGAR